MSACIKGQSNFFSCVIFNYIDSCLQVVYFGMRLEIFLLLDYESNAICFNGK